MPAGTTLLQPPNKQNRKGPPTLATQEALAPAGAQAQQIRFRRRDRRSPKARRNRGAVPSLRTCLATLRMLRPPHFADTADFFELGVAPGPPIIHTDYRSAGKCFRRSSPPDTTAGHRPIRE